MTGQPTEKRFEDFFSEGTYVVLKNYLYNYRVRVRRINTILRDEPVERLLEVGSGLSPIVTGTDEAVYSELSFRALQALRRFNEKGHFVVADGTRLPFRDGAFSHVVCSEVLEHVERDQAALSEIGRVLQHDGKAFVTVPHRKFYFAADDRFVHHFRRYEIAEMAGKMQQAGLNLLSTRKVLGPLEKVTMFSAVMCFALLERIGVVGGEGAPPGRLIRMLAKPFDWSNRAFTLLARLDAAIMPKALATVILFEAAKPRAARTSETV